MKNENFKDIKTFADALKATGRPETPSFDNVPEDMREYFRKQYEAVVITEAINGEWKADWSDDEQKKWIPWFLYGSSGFAFRDTNYDCSCAHAGGASRLCFETDAQATHAGRQFPELYGDMLTK